MNLAENKIEFDVHGKDGSSIRKEIVVRRLCLARNTGRNAEAAGQTLDSFREQGYAVHKTGDVCQKSRYLLTSDDLIEVQGPQTSGEVEVVAVFDPSGIIVTVGSDHGDRTIETMWTDALGKIYDTAKIKQMCPAVVAKDAWWYRDVQDHWDQLNLRSYVTLLEKRALYQDSSLNVSLDLEHHMRVNPWLKEAGTILFCGTVDVVNGLPQNFYQFQPHIKDLEFPSDFYLELHDPVLGRSISHYYRVQSVEPQRSISL